MKTGSFLLALMFAAAPLGAQAGGHSSAPATAATPQATLPQALDSAASHSAGQTSAEVQRGTATPTEHGPAAAGGHGECAAHTPGDIITPHITDSRCIEVPNGWRIWEPR